MEWHSKYCRCHNAPHKWPLSLNIGVSLGRDCTTLALAKPNSISCVLLSLSRMAQMLSRGATYTVCCGTCGTYYFASLHLCYCNPACFLSALQSPWLAPCLLLSLPWPHLWHLGTTAYNSKTGFCLSPWLETCFFPPHRLCRLEESLRQRQLHSKQNGSWCCMKL